MNRNLSLGLIIAGVVLVVFALLEHFFVTILLVPHLAIYLGVVAVILAGVGIYGLVTKSRSQA